MKKILTSFLALLLLAGCAGVKLYKEKISCEYDSQTYEVGEKVAMKDGCNFCVCGLKGELDACSEIACEDEDEVDSEENVEEDENVGLANPASVKCEEDGFTLEIREDEEGNQSGVCIDEENNECDEWEYFRNECMLGDKTLNFEAILKDVSGGESSGSATSTLSRDSYTHEVEATLPSLEEGFFYEGWLVKKLPTLDVISSGVMVEDEEGKFHLALESKENLTDYKSVVITLESGERDETPEIHILEGNLEEIQ
jgi:putative hemolysin